MEEFSPFAATPKEQPPKDPSPEEVALSYLEKIPVADRTLGSAQEVEAILYGLEATYQRGLGDMAFSTKNLIGNPGSPERFMDDPEHTMRSVIEVREVFDDSDRLPTRETLEILGKCPKTKMYVCLPEHIRAALFKIAFAEGAVSATSLYEESLRQAESPGELMNIAGKLVNSAERREDIIKSDERRRVVARDFLHGVYPQLTEQLETVALEAIWKDNGESLAGEFGEEVNKENVGRFLDFLKERFQVSDEEIESNQRVTDAVRGLRFARDAAGVARIVQEVLKSRLSKRLLENS